MSNIVNIDDWRTPEDEKEGNPDISLFMDKLSKRQDAEKHKIIDFSRVQNVMSAILGMRDITHGMPGATLVWDMVDDDDAIAAVITAECDGKFVVKNMPLFAATFLKASKMEFYPADDDRMKIELVFSDLFVAGERTDS